MAQIDRFIELLHQRRGEALNLAAGQHIGLALEGAVRPLTRDALTEAQVTSLLLEIAPAEARAGLANGAESSFSYTAPTGEVDIHVQRSNGGLCAAVRSVTAGAANRAAPSAPPGPQQPESTSSPDLTEARQQLERLLIAMVEAGASDLHLRVGEPPTLRHDGRLVRQDEPPIDVAPLRRMLESNMSPRDQRIFAETGDADYAYEIDHVARFRCNAALDRRGPVAVFRVIPTRIPTCDELGVSTAVQNLCYLTKGLVLVTGPTGSGKSTTLAALIDLINTERQDHILTIEDPIEFVHQGKKCLVTQRQVGEHTKSFKSGLRAALREDPDVVLIGEMRDLETVEIAIETAETGHLVFGTLHTTTAPSTLDRIIDQFPADRQSQIRVMLSESLRGVIAQTLCRKVGGGRIAAWEVLLTTPAVSNLVREGKTFQLPSIIQTNRKLGMVTMNDSLVELVEQNLVEAKEAYMKAVDKAGIEATLKAKGHDLSFLREA